MRFLARLVVWLTVPVVAIFAFGLGAMVVVGPAAATTYATANGQGSTYAALAFQQWTQTVQDQGLNVNYTATGSPSGLQAFEQNTADFAGTEAEYSELYADTGGTANAHVARGFAYTPDVAGAIAIIYHVALNATGSGPINYLQLTRMTIARIFLGVITNWDSPTITAANKGLVLPNKPIVLDFRTGQSGTSALFYDFVAKTDPSQFTTWAHANSFPTTAKVWEVDNGTGGFPPSNSQGFTGSTQQAQSVAGPGGLWSIGYDEFGYAKVYNDDVAWVENAAGDWVQPYALNIAAALQTAVLAPDTSQTLLGVYGSTNPLAYPISAYSYVLYQCAPTSARPTCKSRYASTGITNTMAKFMRYIACTGQVKMATIGYSPLPTQLSQFLANAIGYLTGQTAPTLTGSNCANPQFQGGSLGVGALPPPDPQAGIASLAPHASSAPGGGASTGKGAVKGAVTGGAGAQDGTGSAAVGGVGSLTGSSGAHGGKGSSGRKSAGGSSGATATTTNPTGLTGGKTQGASAATSNTLPPTPVAYVGPLPGSTSPWPLLALFLFLLVPVIVVSWGGRRRRAAAILAGQTALSASGPDLGTKTAPRARDPKVEWTRG